MTILSGTIIANKIKDEIALEINSLKEFYHQVPHLCVLLVGNSEQSEIYVRIKKMACERVGIKFTLISFGQEASETSIIEKITELNYSFDVNGILLQLPLPSHLSEQKLIDTIIPTKDVDCLTSLNIGKLISDRNIVFAPCTPLGIIRLLDAYNINLANKSVVIIGRSLIVGIPLFHMLLRQNATVTIVHSKTTNPEQIVRSADIVISAVGIANFINSNWIKPNAVIIDVGINKVDGKIIGDVDYESCSMITSHISPVPGGVGPMTVSMVLENTLKSFKMSLKQDMITKEFTK